MKTVLHGNIQTKVIWAVFVLCLLVVLWQSIATWYWWPRVRSTIDNTAALTDSNIALLRQFDWSAVYIPAVIGLLGMTFGLATTCDKSAPRHAKRVGVLLIIFGLAGLALAGYALARGILDMA